MLHTNYRFDEKLFALNSRPAGGEWGEEVYITNVQFTPGETVTLTAKAECNGFVIYINGEERGYFEYRLPATSVTRVFFWAYPDSGSELESLQIFY